MSSQRVEVATLTVANDRPFTLFGGINVLESRELALQVAQAQVEVCERLGIPCVFKASFDKANRSSIDSFRGPGLEQGLQILAEVKREFGVPGDDRCARTLAGRSGGGGLRGHSVAGISGPPD